MLNKRLITALISLVIVSLSLTAVSVAWVSMNRQVQSNNQKMTIQPVSDVTTISCYALRYDGTYGAVCYKIGEGEGEVLDVEMTEFDRIFRDRAVNTPLIYVIELANVPDTAGYSITVKVPCAEKYISTGGNTTNNFVSAENGTSFSIQNYISNIISVKVGCSGEITDPTPTLNARVDNNVSLFNTQRTAFRDIITGEQVGQFATFTDDNEDGYGTYAKTDSVQVSLSQSTYHNDLYTIDDELEDTGNHLILYIQFDYEDALMDAYINLMNSDEDRDISFADDLGVIQILVGTGGN